MKFSSIADRIFKARKISWVVDTLWSPFQRLRNSKQNNTFENSISAITIFSSKIFLSFCASMYMITSIFTKRAILKVPYTLTVNTPPNFNFVAWICMAKMLFYKVFFLLQPLEVCCTDIKCILCWSRDGHHQFATIICEIGLLVPEITPSNTQTSKCFFSIILVSMCVVFSRIERSFFKFLAFSSVLHAIQNLDQLIHV